MGSVLTWVRRLALRVQLLVAASPLRPLLGSRTVVLEYVGPRSGALVRLPVWALPRDGGWLVAVGDADNKRWWRSFRTPHRAVVEDGTGRTDVVGVVLTGPERDDNLAAYIARVPGARALLRDDAPVIRLNLAAAGSD